MLTQVRSNGGQILVGLLLIAGLVAVGPVAATSSFTSLDLLRIGIALILGIGLLIVLVLGQQGLELGFYLWIATFALGYRTIHLTGRLSIHPSEVLIWLLFIAISVEKIQSAKKITWHLSLALTLMLGLGLVGMVTAYTNFLSWDGALDEFKNFLVAIPIFGVVQELLRDKQRQSRAIVVFVFAIFFIALTGVFEFRFPSIAGRLGPLFSTVQSYASADGFVRAAFSFWGGLIVTSLLTTSLPFVLYLLGKWKSFAGRFVLVLGAGVTIYGIYISGFRHLWLATAALFIIYFVSRRSIKGVLASVAGLGAFVVFAPDEFLRRMVTLVNIGTSSVDSSTLDRIDYLRLALLEVQRNPLLGFGWNASGLVHNDYVQIAANVGVLAAVLFTLVILLTLSRLWISLNRSTDTDTRNLSYALLISLIGYVMTLATGDVISLPQTMIPFWFVLALASQVTQNATQL